MRIAEINMMHIGSTGKIMFGIAQTASMLGHEVYTFSPRYYQRGKKFEDVKIPNHFFFGSSEENKIHYILAEATGLHGYGSFVGTKQLIKKLETIKPDILHLHNLHNMSINLPMLFSYIKKRNIKTVWTLHDCWPITGKCPYFDIVKCRKWMNGCYKCPVLHEYPKAYIDIVREMWKFKRKWFTGIKNMILVSPSIWLAENVKKSYLSVYPIKVINNGIDLSIFKPVIKIDVYKKYGISSDKKIVLGVSFDWGKRKGLDAFIELSKRLSDEYQIVLVGTNESVDKILPSSIISVHRTQNQNELAEIYSISNVYVNPTREDNFPTVNLEALACGTPVITYNTGGSPECIDDSCGICVECDDYDSLTEKICYVCEDKAFSSSDCVKKASNYEQNACYKKYIDLYQSM